ncbi:unnamed protein product [Dovyalis caffra]|uniref:Uncharacterized protein n=1 Tax=Dovyalis caffra TaxID=77055 RepID=A0AAV1SPV3_9ROSI|nr:unnamed protein product [Dovyalis caffra]
MHNDVLRDTIPPGVFDLTTTCPSYNMHTIIDGPSLIIHGTIDDLSHKLYLYTKIVEIFTIRINGNGENQMATRKELYAKSLNIT